MPDWARFDPAKYESRWQASRARLQAAHEFREGDCVPVLSSEYGSYWAWVLGIDIADYYEDIDTQVEVQMRGLTWHHENVPDDRTDASIGFDCGPIGEAVVFDCDIERPRGTSPWIIPRIFSAEDVDRLEVVDPRHNPRVQALLERGREYKQRALDLGVKIPIGTGGLGIHPPLSAACALAGADWVYLNMLAEPALVLRLFEKCFRAFCLCQEYMYELHGGGPGGLGLADDNSSFVSDALYRQMVLPFNLALYEKFGPTSRYLHTDGPNEAHYETYARILKLNHMDIGGWSTLRPALSTLKPARCIIHGGLNNRDLYAGWTEKLEQKIRSTIRLAAPGGGFELAIGGETYAGTDPEVLAKTWDYAHEVGKYPIDLPEEPLPGEDDGLPSWQAVSR